MLTGVYEHVGHAAVALAAADPIGSCHSGIMKMSAHGQLTGRRSSSCRVRSEAHPDHKGRCVLSRSEAAGMSQGANGRSLPPAKPGVSSDIGQGQALLHRSTARWQGSGCRPGDETGSTAAIG